MGIPLVRDKRKKKTLWYYLVTTIVVKENVEIWYVVLVRASLNAIKDCVNDGLFFHNDQHELVGVTWFFSEHDPSISYFRNFQQHLIPFVARRNSAHGSTIVCFSAKK
jgi:hypothetical protein